MSDVEIGRPEGRTQYSDKPMEIYEQQRRPGEPLGAGELNRPGVSGDLLV
ncbi:hypothetical protein NYE39_12360 [Janibacter sp. FSL W8-0316]